jgi:VCBS repeat-containing protein
MAADGSYTYVVNDSDPAVESLRAGDSLADFFNYTMSDASVAPDTALLTITVHGVNDSPKFISAASVSVGENTTSVIGLTTTDVDAVDF